MKRCKICRKKPKLDRRVNSAGILFCSDDCYDHWDHPTDDYDHPYVNDYEMIRLDYMKWEKEYEKRLFSGFLYGYPSPRYLIEELQDVVDAYYEYELLEGRDGVYSAEIYTYLRRFDELREVIRVWTIEEHQHSRVFKTMERERNERWERVWEEKEA